MRVCGAFAVEAHPFLSGGKNALKPESSTGRKLPFPVDRVPSIGRCTDMDSHRRVTAEFMLALNGRGDPQFIKDITS